MDGLNCMDWKDLVELVWVNRMVNWIGMVRTA